MIFIDAVNEVTRERSMSYLKPEHQERVANAYHDFKDVEGFAKVASLEDIRANDGNLSIPLYVRGKAVSEGKAKYVANELKQKVQSWEMSSRTLNKSIHTLLQNLEGKK